MTPAERTRMREILRTAASQARLPGAELTHPGRFVPPVFTDDLETRFRREFTALGGEVHEASSPADVAAIVAMLAAKESSSKVMAWDDERLPVRGVHEALQAAGLTVMTEAPETAASAAHRRELATVSVGVTGSAGALAETGSIVLASGEGQGRLASLLPRIHVAIIERKTLMATLPLFISAHPEQVTAGANFVCITGPSRTADIEHTLARGVHGPRDIHAVLVG